MMIKDKTNFCVFSYFVQVDNETALVMKALNGNSQPQTPISQYLMISLAYLLYARHCQKE